MRRAYTIGLPVAVIIASALVARAIDATWIANNQAVSSAKLRTALDEIETRLKVLEGERDCPRGYARAMNVCKKGSDEMVTVGSGAEAFWIDRYEATLWEKPDGTGAQYGLASGDAHNAGFLQSGQWLKPVYALSVAGKTPSRWLTWFQASEACRLSGKRLPTGDEWLAAARGTPDPGAHDGLLDRMCNTNSTGVRDAGRGSDCASAWGAHDMIGNLWEWTALWQAGLGNATTSTTWTNTARGDFMGDGTWNITSSIIKGEGEGMAVGMPGAGIRGGHWGDGTRAGLFALGLLIAPSYWSSGHGFRCVLR